jgi:hypothetical protein
MYKKSLVPLIVSFFLFVSCDVTRNEMRTSADPAALPGDWKVDRFQEGTVNETSSFNRFRFRFEANGTFLFLENGNELARGTWKLMDGNRKLDIDVPLFRNEEEAAARFGDDVYEIHDDWNILEFSSNRMRLNSDGEEFILVRE